MQLYTAIGPVEDQEDRGCNAVRANRRDWCRAKQRSDDYSGRNQSGQCGMRIAQLSSRLGVGDQTAKARCASPGCCRTTSASSATASSSERVTISLALLCGGDFESKRDRVKMKLIVILREREALDGRASPRLRLPSSQVPLYGLLYLLLPFYLPSNPTISCSLFSTYIFWLLFSVVVVVNSVVYRLRIFRPNPSSNCPSRAVQATNQAID